jgi:hypothetical protein
MRSAGHGLGWSWSGCGLVWSWFLHGLVWQWALLDMVWNVHGLGNTWTGLANGWDGHQLAMRLAGVGTSMFWAFMGWLWYALTKNCALHGLVWP